MSHCPMDSRENHAPAARCRLVTQMVPMVYLGRMRRSRATPSNFGGDRNKESY